MPPPPPPLPANIPLREGAHPLLAGQNLLYHNEQMRAWELLRWEQRHLHAEQLSLIQLLRQHLLVQHHEQLYLWQLVRSEQHHHHQQQGGEQARQFDELRRLADAVLAQPGPAFLANAATLPFPAPHLAGGTRPDDDFNCRVCGGRLVFKWRRRVLRNRHEADYHECAACQALQVATPAWLDETETDQETANFGNPGGLAAFARTFAVHCYLCAVRHVDLLPPQARVLDFSGHGLLARMLEDAGFDTWLSTPDVREPFLAPDRFLADLAAVPDASFDAVTPFELFEHLSGPHRVARELGRLLAPSGLMLLSAEVYDPDRHGPDWHYLAGPAGRHITFFSHRALAHFAAGLGFASLAHFGGEPTVFTLFSSLPAPEFQARLARAGELLRSGAFLERLTRRWQLSSLGYLTVPAEPRVEPAIGLQGGLTCAS
jgi:SAM-dependent methyltransferase